MNRILIAEDDANIARSLKKNFEDAGFTAETTPDGLLTLKAVAEGDYDILLLDWRMPGLSGLEVCKKLRSQANKLPVVLLTALSDTSNKIEALNCGADDYIVKPFSFEEVLARVNAVLRRDQFSKNEMHFSAGLVLDLNKRTLSNDQDELHLPDKEFDLLKYMLLHKGTILNKEQLAREIWELPFYPTTNFVEVTIKNLRKKLDELAGQKFIKTVYGEGYLFVDETV